MAGESAEGRRLAEAREQGVPWRKWGPYLSERQWGTVREDYSKTGDAWAYFSHDQARSRVYHWGEEGLAGFCDERARLCFALALWNGKDPILKERLFGLTNGEGNHGEDVKEYYFYLDSTPTHSYMKYLYKYPQREFPYEDLVSTSRRLGKQDLEYELVDTKVFDEDRYFDVFVEYAKATPEDTLIEITVVNRGPEPAALHVLPTLWFRNTWLWWDKDKARPALREAGAVKGMAAVGATHRDLGERFLYCEGTVPLLFTENETNNKRVFGSPNRTPYVKDGIHELVVHGREEAVNPARTGTKAAAHYQLTVGPREQAVVRLRLTDAAPDALGKAYAASKGSPFGKAFDQVLDARRREADEFYRSITPASAGEDEARVMRQALSGMLWSKQCYIFDVNLWLEEHGVDPLGSTSNVRNQGWFHMLNEQVISMPDKWEYPWFAAWDLAFHAVALSAVDPDFAKAQLEVMLRADYFHPNGQIPAYEWNFSDVNPPVHAWATVFLINVLRARGAKVDFAFLAQVFGKLLMNFTWWVNRKDRMGKNVFEGGFLGLDNIGVFDRSAPLPTGGYLEQADGTAWMAFFCQNMLQLGAELATHDPAYEELTEKFVDHFLWIALAMNRPQGGLWDEEDGFYYDVLRRPDGSSTPLKVRSIVGLLPLCATTVVEKYQRERFPHLVEHAFQRAQQMPQILESIHLTGPGHRGVADRGIIALVNERALRRILTRMLDEKEFLSPHGIRSVSRYHLEHPYVFNVEGREYRVGYVPGDSDSGMFGGNSNWRGPVWFPLNCLIVRALLHYYLYYGDRFTIECPTGSGNRMNLFEVSKELSRRLIGIFMRDEQGRRPVFGGAERFQRDPHWRDHLLFYEYFHGDNGAGIGASHQTGWTGLVGTLIQLFGILDARKLLETGLGAPPTEREPRRPGGMEAPAPGR
jgi:hypothetical protein